MTLASRKLVVARAEMFRLVRDFFSRRDVLEVDVPSIARAPTIDLHIEPMRVDGGFLITSPESGMKQLLACGSGDIFQMGHVFRKGERGRLHHPEFTMIEWYRVGMEYEVFIDEVLDLISLFVGVKVVQRFTYAEAFIRQVGLDPFSATLNELRNIDCLPESARVWEREVLLHYLMGFVIEPGFDPDVLTVVSDFPTSEAALAKIEGGVAMRFEVYHGGVELANGYDELSCAMELRARFEKSNRLRDEALPLDEALLEAMKGGFPECCGVAVGFDRLMMLKLGASDVHSVII